eukprot:15258971-Alexandrium_andersonii.AAC.1
MCIRDRHRWPREGPRGEGPHFGVGAQAGPLKKDHWAPARHCDASPGDVRLGDAYGASCRGVRSARPR